MRNVDKLKLVIGLVVLFAGLDIAILLSHMSRFIGIIFIIIGIGILATTIEGAEERPRRRKEKAEERKEENIATRIIDVLTLRGKLKPLLPIAGVVIILLVGFYNIFISNKQYLGSNDYVALILAGVLVIYNFIPRKYHTERDFAFLFSILLFVFLVIPTTLLNLTSDHVDTNSPLTYYLLSAPTVALVSLFGIPAVTPGYNQFYGEVAYNTIELTGTDGGVMFLGISLSCSGLYSVAIFVSAFIAFIAIEYKRVNRKVLGLLGLGILLAWIANILRMAIIVVVGRYYGSSTMVWVHNNIGEIIFMIWVIAFWLVMFKYLGFGEEPPKPKKRTEKEGKCPGCGDELTPGIESRRCDCGTISHSHCLETNDGRCFTCGLEIKL